MLVPGPDRRGGAYDLFGFDRSPVKFYGKFLIDLFVDILTLIFVANDQLKDDCN
jgi:hypothetical protein